MIRTDTTLKGGDLDQSEIDYWLHEFATTCNTLAAWKAFGLCRSLGRAVPAVIMAELDRLASDLFTDTGPVETRAARVLTRKVGKGQADAWSELRRLERDAQFVADFTDLVDEQGVGETRACMIIADRYPEANITPSGVRRAVKRFLH